jgi:chromate transporter
LKEYLDLIWTFIIVGVSTFGGGYAMLPVVERELIKKRGWVEMDEVMDYFTIAQVTPGIIAINVATFVGFKRKGFLGGLLATISFVIPGLSLMILVSLFVKRFAEHPLVLHAFTGIRLAVGAVLVDMLIKLFKGVFKNYKTIIIFVIAFVLSAVFSLSPVYIVMAAGIAGFFFFPAKKAKSDSESGDSPKEGAL